MSLNSVRIPEGRALLGRISVTVAIALLGAGPALAQFQVGDLLLEVAPPTPLQNTTQPSIKIYSTAGAFRSEVQLPLNFTVVDLNYHSSSLLGISSGPAIYSVSPTGTLTPAGPNVPARSFVFDRQGDLFIADGTTLKKFDSANQLLQTYSLPQAASQIDLASDQCTMYYVTPSDPVFPHLLPVTIGRYDVCASQPLAALNAALPTTGVVGTFRVLSGNEVLLGTSAGVLRITQNGTIARTYTGGPLIALDVSGQSFWEAGGSDIAQKIDLASGNVLASSDSYGVNFILYSMTVIGEPRAAVAGGAAIPTLSDWMLICLAAALATIAVARFVSR